MKHLPSIEETIKQIDIIYSECARDEDGFPKAGEIDKKAVRTTLTKDRHALGEMILEWVESKRINLAVPPNNEIVSAALAGVDTTLTDLKTFIKSEIMGKE